jgi:hypothetical protein
VGAINLQNDISDWLKEGIKQMAGKQEKVEVNQKEILQVDFNKAKNKLSKLYDLQLEGNIDKEMFLIKQKELTENITTLESRLVILNSDKQKAVKKAEDIFGLIGSLEKLYNRADNFEKAQILKFLGKDYIFEGRDIKAKYRVPFNYFAHASI